MVLHRTLFSGTTPWQTILSTLKIKKKKKEEKEKKQKPC